MLKAASAKKRNGSRPPSRGPSPRPPSRAPSPKPTGWTQVEQNLPPFAGRETAVAKQSSFLSPIVPVGGGISDSPSSEEASFREPGRTTLYCQQNSQLSQLTQRSIQESPVMGQRSQAAAGDDDDDEKEDDETEGVPEDQSQKKLSRAKARENDLSLSLNAREFYQARQNSKCVLLSQCIGLRAVDDNDRFLGDVMKDPFSNVPSKSQFHPNAQHLKDEVVRRARQLRSNPVPAPTYWSKKRCYAWLMNNPIADIPDTQWVRATEEALYKALLAAASERETTDRENKNWTNDDPWLRLYIAMVQDDSRTALSRLHDTLDRPSLDARNNENRPLTFYEVVANQYNDNTWIASAEVVPDLHENFSYNQDYYFDEMPGGEITPEQVKARYADSRARLIKVSFPWEWKKLVEVSRQIAHFSSTSSFISIQIISDWEKSGSGFGQRDNADTSWGHFSEENRQIQDGDNRSSFLTGENTGKTHLLYLWHLADTAGIMTKLLNVLSKDVAADCHSNLYVSTQQVQHKSKRKAAEELEREDTKAFRNGIQQSFENLAISKKEERLSQLRKEIKDAKISLIRAADEEEKVVWREYLENLEDDFLANKEEIDYLKLQLAKKTGFVTADDEGDGDTDGANE